MSKVHLALALLRAIIPAANDNELLMLLAMSRFEGGGYGQAWNGAHNWGSVQCRSRPPCPAGCTPSTDVHADGTGYTGCYRRYASSLDGARDFVREVYRRPDTRGSARNGDPVAFADALRASGYFEAPADRYALALRRNAAAVTAQTGLEWTNSGADTLGYLTVAVLGLAVALALRGGLRSRRRREK